MNRLATLAGAKPATLPQMPPPPSNTQTTQMQGGFQTRPIGDMGSVGVGGSGNTNAQAVMPDMSDFQPFQDAVFEQYERTTQPELERRRARMNQDLVNRGITPGSEAYEREMTRFMQMENDAFSTAQRSALEQALQAQGQFFNQGLGQAQINAGLQQARIAADTSRYGTDQTRASALERALIGYETARRGQDLEGLLGLGRLSNERYGMDQNYSLGLGGLQNQRVGLDQSQQEIDNAMMMNLLGLPIAYSGFNNNALGADRGYSAGILGNFLPGTPFTPTDVAGAYGIASNAAQANAMNVQSQNNATTSALGSLAAAAIFASDRNMKQDIEEVDAEAELDALRKVPVSRWKYKGTDREHIGPMAQDFGAAMTDDPDARVIHGVDAFGSVMAGIQALADRMDGVMDRLDRLEAENVSAA